MSFKNNPFQGQKPPFPGVKGQQPQQSQQQQLNVNVEDLENLKCKECGNQLFEIKFLVKKLSPIITGEKETKYANIQVMTCSKCGHVPEEMGGKFLQKDD